MNFGLHPDLKPDRSPHLTEEQFAEFALGGDAGPAGVAHLAACAACRAELADFSSSMESFNTASLAWSEAQAAPSLRPLVQSPARRRKPRPAWAIASWALAGCVALASAVSIGTHRQQGHTASDPQALVETEDSTAQIERDNKLLLAVDQATSGHVASPLQEYGLEAPPNPRAQTTEPE